MYPSTLGPLIVLVQMRGWGGGGDYGVSANECSCAHHVTSSPNKLWRSTSLCAYSHKYRHGPLGVKVNLLQYLECDIEVLVEVVSSHGIRVRRVVNPSRIVVRHVVPLFTGGGIL